MEQYRNQRPIKVACACCWSGMAPSELIEFMGTGEMGCPRCYKPFSKWPKAPEPPDWLDPLNRRPPAGSR